MHCNYHPTQPAWWHCHQCNKALCPKCIIQRKGGFQDTESFYLCPKCNTRVDNIGISHIIEPFWKRLHKCFAYPLSAIPPIALIFGLALLSCFFTGPGLFSTIIRFVIWAVMLKYAYEALRTTAAGNLSPPALSGDTLNRDIHIVFKQIALFVALLLLFIFVIGPMGPVIWILFMLAVVIGLPAMIIILAINDNLRQALNPVYFIGIAYRIGWGYLLLFFFLIILLSAPGVLGYYFIQHMPDSLQLFLWNAAQNYYTLVSYHLMGYVILQYHDRVGHNVDVDTLLTSTYPEGIPTAQGPVQSASDPQAVLLNDITPLIQEGDLDRAVALIQQRTELNIDNPELSDRYVQLLKNQQRTEELLGYAPAHLDLLAKANRKSEAIELYLFCSQKKEDFSASAMVLFKLGGWLAEDEKARDAVKAFNRLIKSHPGDVLVPKTYYRAAQLFHEQLKKTENARKILQALIRKYPDHDMARFAEKYLGTMT